MTRARSLAAALVAAAMLLLASCTGLPTSGPVSVGLPAGEEPDEADFTQVAADPVKGADPQEIVEGFLDAGITPDDDWSIARKYLTEEMNDRWRPGEGVIVDESSVSRTITAVGDVESDDATEADVDVQLSAVALVDSTGVYTGGRGNTAPLSFRLEREKGGEWRIAEAPNGIVLDATSFPLVFTAYPMQYYDPSWSYLVPDVRWFPQRPSNVTAVTQELVSGVPTPWLAPGVRSAFTEEVGLAPRPVAIDQSQVAEVDLTRSALSLDATTLARMRTQLEATLAPLGVVEVRFTVDQRPLDAGEVQVEQPRTDAGTLVLTEDGFGTAVGDQLAPVGELSGQIQAIPDPISVIDVSVDETAAAVQLADGSVYRVADGDVSQLGTRSGLIAPNIDNRGYIWTVPRSDPGALQAWDAEIRAHSVENGWPAASAISALRVAADGTRVAALVTVGGQRRAVIAAVIRDEDGAPVRLGEMQEVGRFVGIGEPRGLAWVGSDSLVILSASEEPRMIEQPVGGPAEVSGAPEASATIAGARSASGVRILDDEGVLFAQRGSAWQESATGILVLGTRSGQ